MSPSASTKSRSTIARSSPTSRGLVWWVRSQPLLAHCRKLMLGSDGKQFGGGQHRRYEMVAAPFPPAEFVPRHHMRVDLPAQLFTDAGEQVGNSAKAQGGDDHQVHVAFRAGLAPGDGSKD